MGDWVFHYNAAQGQVNRTVPLKITYSVCQNYLLKTCLHKAVPVLWVHLFNNTLFNVVSKNRCLHLAHRASTDHQIQQFPFNRHINNMQAKPPDGMIKGNREDVAIPLPDSNETSSLRFWSWEQGSIWAIK